MVANWLPSRLKKKAKILAYPAKKAKKKEDLSKDVTEAQGARTLNLWCNRHKPKTNALPLRQGSEEEFDERIGKLKQYIGSCKSSGGKTRGCVLWVN